MKKTVTYYNQGSSGATYSQLRLTTEVTKHSSPKGVLEATIANAPYPSVLLDQEQAEHLRDWLLARFPVSLTSKPVKITEE